MSSIIIQGLVTDAKVLTNTQSILFPDTESGTKFRLSNTKAPASGVTNKTSLEFRNTELAGYRFVHSYSNAGSGNASPGTLTLEQFTGDASVGTSMFTVAPNGTITINSLALLNVSSVTASTIVATTSLVSPEIGIGITASATNSALQFDNNRSGRYITLYELANNAHQYSGFGATATILYAQLSATSESFRIFAAASANASNTVFTLTGTGNLTIPGTLTANIGTFTTQMSADRAVVGSTTQATDCALTVTSDTKGIGVPRVSTTLRNNLTTTLGNILYCSSQAGLHLLTDYGWTNVACAQQAQFVYRVAQGVQGGASIANSWQNRLLNETRYNNIPGCSIGSSEISLPVGTYEIDVVCVNHATSYTIVALQNVINGNIEAIGMAVEINTTGGHCFLRDRFIVSNSQANIFKIINYTYLASTWGLGKSSTPQNPLVINEYLSVKITQVK